MKTNVLGHEIIYDGTDTDRAEKLSELMCNKKSNFHDSHGLDPVNCEVPDPTPEVDSQ